MKTLKNVMQTVLAASMICLFNSCSGCSEENFWEGQVHPGTYTGTWEEIAIGPGKPNRYTVTLTIYEDRIVKCKQECTILWGDGATSIEVATGHIYKHTETYNGERKVWYTMETHPEPGSREAFDWSLSTSLELKDGSCQTWQSFTDDRFKKHILHSK